MNAESIKRRRLTVEVNLPDIVSSNSDNNADFQLISRKSPEKNDSRSALTSKERKYIVSQSSDEQESNDEEDEQESKSCRLRNCLNEDCLSEIFQYLGVYDLLQLCELNIYYENLIVNRVIGNILIDFTKVKSCWFNHIFRMFGKKIRKIEVVVIMEDFEPFLNLIKQNCSVGRITEMALSFDSLDAPALEEAMPYFSNLRKLVVNKFRMMSPRYQEFLTCISNVSTNLTHLTLEHVHVRGKWLLAGGMKNLKELRLRDIGTVELAELAELAEFLRTKSKLEVFSYTGDSDILPVVDALTEYCTQLTAFADFHLVDPNHHDPQIITNQMKQRYNFVRLFDNVKKLGLTSYTLCGSDLYFPLVKMSAQNKVEELKIYINRKTAKFLPENQRMHWIQEYFPHFNSLKSVELQMQSVSTKDIELDIEFICEFISKQPNIKKFSVSSYQCIRNICKVIDTAPNLNTLGVAEVNMKYLPVEMRKIYKSIKQRRAQQILDGDKEPQPFHVLVNPHQWRELKVYKDVDEILTTTVILEKSIFN